MPEVSVIIPCYNQGQFVDEAVESVLAQTFSDFEIIIVNDGSTDEETNRILKTYDKPQTIVLQTRNHGLGGARNNGIRAAQGKYILPLDADDRIGNTYLEQAVKVLEAQDNIGIVYCEAEFFGDRTGKWELPPYNFPDILLGNIIFCSAFFRKSDWEKTEGYENDLSGWEDYDFWLSIIELGRDVYRIPTILFYYRQRAESMIKSMSWQQQISAYARIMKNHSQLYADNAEFMAEHMLTLRTKEAQAESLIRGLEETIADMRRSRFWKLRERCRKLIKPFRAARESDLQMNSQGVSVK
ncbi:MAG: glycosyltransferase family 2 protein [Pyrinomonadaceae bacterium]|nr:glycosyltransferase family 2 protein [Pyrinomonadaceae bacterium]